MRARGLLGLCLIATVAFPTTAHAQANCSRVVIFTLPGVTWEEVDRVQPPALMALAEQGATASVSVRTNSSRTTYASGFATIGAGTRVSGGTSTGGHLGPDSDGFIAHARVAGIDELRELAAEDGYDAVPGALADALDGIPAIAIGNAETAVPASLALGYERWTLLAAMDPAGQVDLADTGPGLLTAGPQVHTDPVAFEAATRKALLEPCAVTVMDQGDLIRTELLAGPDGPAFADREEALLAADVALGSVAARLDAKDLLMVVSPTSPLFGDVHFGVAVVNGPGFAAGTLLSSASTRREGIVTLPDVAPTVLEHEGLARHPAMLGRAFFTVPAGGDRMIRAIEDDREAVFVDGVRSLVTTVFVVAQVAIYLAIAWILRRRQRGGVAFGGRWLETGALAVVGFPMCTYIAGFVSQHALGKAGFYALLVGLDIAALVMVSLLVSRPLDRLLALTGATCVLLILDVVTGASLQVNTVFSYSPLVAGRFAGFGNTAFSVLGAAAIVTGSLWVQRAGGSRAALLATAALFVVVITVDGAPTWGSDVGGVLAFVPAFGITWLLLAGRRPTWKALGLSALAAVAVLGVFLAFDLTRPPDARTHLARLFEDVRDRGFGAFSDTIGRKVSTNLRVFTSTIWTYFVPPALAFIAWLLLRPKNRWERLAREYPTLRAGLIGGLILCVLGFAVNDSGIVVPAMALSYLVPVALLAHLLLERGEADG
ncbi:MAG: hypothetical protein QOG04_1411 [Actinomycetota bacterium]|jgi:hypothetical protein|nr:hypothetical protein [Actinomycetota bacterium]